MSITCGTCGENGSLWLRRLDEFVAWLLCGSREAIYHVLYAKRSKTSKHAQWVLVGYYEHRPVSNTSSDIWRSMYVFAKNAVCALQDYVVSNWGVESWITVLLQRAWNPSSCRKTCLWSLFIHFLLLCVPYVQFISNDLEARDKGNNRSSDFFLYCAYSRIL